MPASDNNRSTVFVIIGVASAGSDTKIKVTEPANDGNQGKSSKDR
ncbi:unnamed protein product, partial [Rotaria magnacalcarata]